MGHRYERIHNASYCAVDETKRIDKNIDTYKTARR